VFRLALLHNIQATWQLSNRCYTGARSRQFFPFRHHGEAEMKLRTLLTLQAFYPLMAIAYLLASYWQVRSGGVQFSTALPLANITIFLVYAACLLLGVYRRETLYRIAMAAAVLAIAPGGVFMNILNYLQTGLEGYSSFTAWAVGTAINIYGLVWNIIAAIGAYRR
jgi:hypothetical protein